MRFRVSDLERRTERDVSVSRRHVTEVSSDEVAAVESPAVQFDPKIRPKPVEYRPPESYIPAGLLEQSIAVCLHVPRGARSKADGDSGQGEQRQS